MDLKRVVSTIDIEPREYQERLVEKSLRMYSGPFEDRFGRRRPAVRSVLIESPTGSGKTVIGLLVARFLQQQHGYRVGWVAMRRNLLAQAAAENEARDFGVDLQLISMFDSDPPQVDFLVIATMFQPRFMSSLFHQDSAHRLSSRGEEMPATVPILGLFGAHQAKICLVHQRCGLQGLPRLLPG